MVDLLSQRGFEALRIVCKKGFRFRRALRKDGRWVPLLIQVTAGKEAQANGGVVSRQSSAISSQLVTSSATIQSSRSTLVKVFLDGVVLTVDMYEHQSELGALSLGLDGHDVLIVFSPDLEFYRVAGVLVTFEFL